MAHGEQSGVVRELTSLAEKLCVTSTEKGEVWPNS